MKKALLATLTLLMVTAGAAAPLSIQIQELFGSDYKDISQEQFNNLNVSADAQISDFKNQFAILSTEDGEYTAGERVKFETTMQFYKGTALDQGVCYGTNERLKMRFGVGVSDGLENYNLDPHDNWEYGYIDCGGDMVANPTVEFDLPEAEGKYQFTIYLVGSETFGDQKKYVEADTIEIQAPDLEVEAEATPQGANTGDEITFSYNMPSSYHGADKQVWYIDGEKVQDSVDNDWEEMYMSFDEEGQHTVKVEVSDYLTDGGRRWASDTVTVDIQNYKDSDGDGELDRNDDCPNTPGDGEDGCPVEDNQDETDNNQDNSKPEITSFTVPSEVAVGEQVEATVQTSDPDDDTVEVTWNNGVSGGSAFYSFDSAGDKTVEVTASDGTAQVTRSKTVTVVESCADCGGQTTTVWMVDETGQACFQKEVSAQSLPTDSFGSKAGCLTHINETGQNPLVELLSGIWGIFF